MSIYSISWLNYIRELINYWTYQQQAMD